MLPAGAGLVGQMFYPIGVRKRRPLWMSLPATGLVAVALLVATVSTVAQNRRGVARGGFGGLVTDWDGNPLPLASVTVYGDTMALEEQWTDLRGRFLFEPMVAAVSQWITVTSAGFQNRIRPVRPGDTTLTVRMLPTESIGHGLGLAHDVDVVVELPSGVPWQRGDSLRVGEHVNVRVTSYGTGSCTRAGPVMHEVDGNELRIAVGDYYEPGFCHLSRTSHPRTVDHVFESAGEGVISVRSRRGVQVLRLPVSRRFPREGSTR